MYQRHVMILSTKDVSVSDNPQSLKSFYTHIWGKKLLRGGKKLLTYRPPFLPCGTYEKKRGYDLDWKIHILVK